MNDKHLTLDVNNPFKTICWYMYASVKTGTQQNTNFKYKKNENDCFKILIVW